MTSIALRLPRVRVPRSVLKFLATAKPAFLVRREADRLISSPDSSISMNEDSTYLQFYRLRFHRIYYHCFQPLIPSLVGCIRKSKLAPGQAAALRDIYYRTH